MDIFKSKMETSDFDFENLFLIFEESIINNVDENHYDNFLVAYSGGIDSTALLYFSKKIAIKYNKKIRAIHINHNLNKDSNNWENHCINFCKKIGVELICKNLDIILDKGDSIEEKAREARYKSIYEEMHKKTIMMTAHHSEDQSETLLYQLFRGAGVKGLSAMPLIKEINSSYHIRPLLRFNKKNIEDVITYNELNFINDYSNDDINFSRNFIRKKILPTIKERWPNYSETISRSASILSESIKLNEDLAKIDFKKYSHKDKNKIYLDVKELEAYRFNNVIRFWVEENNFRMPSFDQLLSIYKNVFFGGYDKTPFFSCAEYEIRRFNNYVEIMKPLKKHDPSKVYVWEFKKNLIISNLSVNLTWQDLEQRLGFKVNKNVEVKFRKTGENIKINNSNKSLKDFMRENKIPPWERERILLIYIDKELKAIWN